MEWVASILHTISEHGVSSINTADGARLGCQQSTELTSSSIEMDSSVSPKYEIWFLRVCHYISNAVYLHLLFQLSESSCMLHVHLSVCWAPIQQGGHTKRFQNAVKVIPDRIRTKSLVNYKCYCRDFP